MTGIEATPAGLRPRSSAACANSPPKRVAPPRSTRASTTAAHDPKTVRRARASGWTRRWRRFEQPCAHAWSQASCSCTSTRSSTGLSPRGGADHGRLQPQGLASAPRRVNRLRNGVDDARGIARVCAEARAVEGNGSMWWRGRSRHDHIEPILPHGTGSLPHSRTSRVAPDARGAYNRPAESELQGLPPIDQGGGRGGCATVRGMSGRPAGSRCAWPGLEGLEREA